MTHTYNVTGMSCGGCKATVQKLLSGVNGVENVMVDLSKAEAVIEMKEHIPASQLQSALKDHPRYQLDEKKNSQNGNSSHIQPAGIPAVINNVNDNGGDKYYCPMHCEGDKTYDKPGDCPVCGMHLVKQISGEYKEIKKIHQHPVSKTSDNKGGAYYSPCIARAIRRMTSPAIAPCAE